MNERIEELYKKVLTESENMRWNIEDAEKFALLIIRRCAQAANDWYQNHESLHWDPATHILAEFGVEEE